MIISFIDQLWGITVRDDFFRILKIKHALLLAAVLAFGAGTANAADLPVQVTKTSDTDWSGFYAGFNFGYGPGQAILSNDRNLDNDSGETDFSGWFLGGQVGYDFDLHNGFVVGVEGDIEKTWETGSSDDSNAGFVSETLNWTAAVTAHAGYKLTDNILPYILAGAAFANNNIESGSDYEPDFPASDTQTHTGYTFGAGIRANVTDNLAGFIEARYADYGSKQYGGGGDETDPIGPASLTDWTVRSGVNFHF